MATDLMKAGFFSSSNVNCLVAVVVEKAGGSKRQKRNFAEVLF